MSTQMAIKPKATIHDLLKKWIFMPLDELKLELGSLKRTASDLEPRGELIKEAIKELKNLISQKERCLPLLRDMQSGLYYGRDFMKQYNLNIHDFFETENVACDIWANRDAYFSKDSLVELFKEYGFAPTRDEYDQMYVIRKECK